MTTANPTLRADLNKSDLNNLQNMNNRIKYGDMLSTVKAVFTGLAGTTYDITTAASKAAATITGIELESGEMLPPIRLVRSLRVTAATTANSVGTYVVTDAGGGALSPTASTVVGVAKLSDDGKSLVFPSTDVTAFVIEYIPMPAVSLDGQTNSF